MTKRNLKQYDESYLRLAFDERMLRIGGRPHHSEKVKAIRVMGIIQPDCKIFAQYEDGTEYEVIAFEWKRVFYEDGREGDIYTGLIVFSDSASLDSCIDAGSGFKTYLYK